MRTTWRWRQALAKRATTETRFLPSGAGVASLRNWLALWQDSAMFPWDVLVTGAVGIAGIGGTLWQGKRSREAQTANLSASLDAAAENLKLGIGADSERARLAEKRRIYAACLSATNELVSAVAEYTVYLRNDEEDRMKLAFNKMIERRDVLANAISEVRLIAPKKMGEQAQEVQKFCDGLWADAQSEDIESQDKTMKDPRFSGIRAKLYIAMRADLGESD